MDGTLRPHQQGQDVFRAILSEDLEWKPFAAFPPSVRLAVVVVLPGNTSHFHWAKSGEYVARVTAIGPLGIDYSNPKDDPRNGRSGP